MLRKVHVGNKKRQQIRPPSRRSSCHIKRPDDGLSSSTSAAVDAPTGNATRPIPPLTSVVFLSGACNVQRLICVYGGGYSSTSHARFCSIRILLSYSGPPLRTHDSIHAACNLFTSSFDISRNRRGLTAAVGLHRRSARLPGFSHFAALRTALKHRRKSKKKGTIWFLPEV